MLSLSAGAKGRPGKKAETGGGGGERVVRKPRPRERLSPKENHAVSRGRRVRCESPARRSKGRNRRATMARTRHTCISLYKGKARRAGANCHGVGKEPQKKFKKAVLIPRKIVVSLWKRNE